MTKPWLIVAGDLTPLGGMDKANYALARHLASRPSELHLVTHRAWPDLVSLPGVHVHVAWRPFNRHLLGGPMLARMGRLVWTRLQRSGALAIVNGGNCAIAAANWVHYVHAAFAPAAAVSLMRAKAQVAYGRDVAAERDALHRARVVICNSLRTKHDLVERVGLPDARVHVVYYGSDPVALSPVTAEERAAARRAWGWSLDRPLVGFVGALGDRRKAFDTAFTAWSALCGRAAWDADLIVVGGGAELDAWKARARASGLHERMRFLGFRADVPDVLKALDAVVHPARYEPYGLSPHEALCRGLPALVTASAGIAELYPSTLHDLLLEDPNDAGELEARLWQWRLQIERYRDFTAPFSRSLRARSWDAMAAEIASLVERAA